MNRTLLADEPSERRGFKTILWAWASALRRIHTGAGASLGFNELKVIDADIFLIARKR